MTIITIKELSIADLKASLDFTKLFLKHMKKKAKQEKIKISEIGAYQETIELEDKLYTELLNKVRFLK